MTPKPRHAMRARIATHSRLQLEHRLVALRRACARSGAPRMLEWELYEVEWRLREMARDEARV